MTYQPERNSTDKVDSSGKDLARVSELPVSNFFCDADFSYRYAQCLYQVSRGQKPLITLSYALLLQAFQFRFSVI